MTQSGHSQRLPQSSLHDDRPPKSLFKFNEARKLSSEKRTKGRASLLQPNLDRWSAHSIAYIGRQLLNDGFRGPFRREDSNPANSRKPRNGLRRGRQIRNGCNSFSVHRDRKSTRLNSSHMSI